MLREPVSFLSLHSSLTNLNSTASRGTGVMLVCLATVKIPTKHKWLSIFTIKPKLVCLGTDKLRG